METRYIQFDHADILTSKKELLLAEINLLHLIRHIKNYQIFKKREIAIKNKTKLEVASLKAKLSLLGSTLPRENIAPGLLPKIKEVKKKIEKEEKSDFQKELDEIRKKLLQLEKE